MLYQILHYPLLILDLTVVFLFFLGLFSPEKSLFWYKKKRTRLMSSIIYFSLIIGISMLHGGIKPQKLIDEEARLEKIEKEQRLLKEKKEEEERIKNKVHKIKNCNDFKDNTGNYTGFIIGDVFYYNETNTYPLRTLVNGTTEKTVTVSFYHFDDDRNQCNIDVEIPVDLNVPNIVSAGEKVRLNFTCTEGQLKSGNIVNSITRVD